MTALLDRVADDGTLQAAWTRVRAKAARGGFDNVTVEEFARDAARHLGGLSREVREARYVPDPLQRIAIPKGPGRPGKRVIGLPTVRDKIVQEAVRSVLEPVLDRTFRDCSYGYRPGKGPARAVARVNHYLSNVKCRWVAAADIDDFFGSLDHDLLLHRLREAIQDDGVLRLVELWLKMGAIDLHGRWHDAVAGVNQGSVISPLLANFYLHPFDLHMTDHGFGLVRYADDFIVLCREQHQAEEALVSATEFLTLHLSLNLNPNPHPVASVDDGFTFLGIQFRGDQREIEPAKLEKIAHWVRRRTGPPAADDFARALRDLNEAVTAWRRYYGCIVGLDGLGRVDAIVLEGLERLVVRGFAVGTFRSLQDAEGALAGCELAIERSPRDRSRLLEQVVRKAKAQVGQARQRQQPGVRAQVRRAKRRYYRQLSQVTELVITTPGSFLGKAQQRIVVRRERKNVCEIPALRLTGITVASRGIALSADVVSHCAENDIPMVFLSPHGKVIATVSAPESSKAAVHMQQLHALHDGHQAFQLAKQFASGKIRNQMSLVKYCGKYRKRTAGAFSEALPCYLASTAELLSSLKRLRFEGDYDLARGQIFSVEGRAAGRYWDMVKILLQGRGSFSGRERRGATDLVNSLLNYGYAVLQSRVYLAILRSGLAPQISFLHALQKDKPTLTFDLMEEFRAQVVDRTVFAMLTRREPLAVDADGALTEASRRRLISRIYTRLATLATFRGRDLRLDQIIEEQARSLVGHLSGREHYRPYVGKW